MCLIFCTVVCSDQQKIILSVLRLASVIILTLSAVYNQLVYDVTDYSTGRYLPYSTHDECPFFIINNKCNQQIEIVCYNRQQMHDFDTSSVCGKHLQLKLFNGYSNQ